MEEKLNQTNSDVKNLQQLLKEREEAFSLLDTHLSKAVLFLNNSKLTSLGYRKSPT